jgi:hypothetical protein
MQVIAIQSPEIPAGTRDWLSSTAADDGRQHEWGPKAFTSAGRICNFITGVKPLSNHPLGSCKGCPRRERLRPGSTLVCRPICLAVCPGTQTAAFNAFCHLEPQRSASCWLKTEISRRCRRLGAGCRQPPVIRAINEA